MTRMALLVLAFTSLSCWADTPQQARQEAEYYVRTYAQHYGVPVDFVRSIIEQESGWQPCAVSRKGAVGLMQLMPETARQLGVRDRCSVKQNVSGGVRYLAWLMKQFHGDLRLVAAAYYAGERAIERRGLRYSNPAVLGYVSSVRARVENQKFRSATIARTPRRNK
ncbi:MAG TPA: lytic transglycosylase domain-containing protein [Terriglobales bacterium]|jgi:soluble lytic murein transglycosylase|nr:lytic transglycosylase domain-containing protein [Terriglobales bacterium]